MVGEMEVEPCLVQMETLRDALAIMNTKRQV